MAAPGRVVCVHADATGGSHLIDLTVPLLSRMIAAARTTAMGVVTGEGPSFRDWHVAGMAGLSIVLSGAWEIEAGSGERRLLGPGSVLVMLDTRGQGHRARCADGVTVLGVGIDDATRDALAVLVAREAVAR